MTKPVDLDAIEARLAARTPGDWGLGDGWVYTDPIYADDQRLTPIGRAAKFADPERQAVEWKRVASDLALIVHAPTDLAALVAEVRTLRAENERLRASSSALADATAVLIGAVKTGSTSPKFAVDQAQRWLDAWRDGEGT